MAISVPIALHDEVSKHVLKSNYNSIADFVKAAVREKIQSDNASVIQELNNMMKIMEDKGFKERVREIRNRGVPEEIDTVENAMKTLGDSIEEKRKWEEKIRNIPIYQGNSKTPIYLSHVKTKKKQAKKEPVILLSKSELTDLIQNVVTEILDKKEKKLG